ncbi:MAG: VIT1/CCC1 family protein [Bacilli bacterium]|jgi:VIT1/CCC1 family predicted Fe2+/Mn2+ transporter|nr:VIT1/CCC1 family protein [Bacilli bacterium]
MNSINETLLKLQRDEITGHLAYKYLAEKEKDEHNKKVLHNISEDELKHYDIYKKYTNQDVKPNKFQLFFYRIFTSFFGFTFIIKIMEKGEDQGIKNALVMEEHIDEIASILKKEEEHENMLIDMLDEDRLKYIGSIVLGLNDALVELTGVIAGVTFAFQNNTLVALTGIITGVSATLSMAASNYLAKKADGDADAIKSSIYTGIAYLITVILLVLPYLLLPNNFYIIAFIIMLVIVMLIIAAFNYYQAIVKEIEFKRPFLEMLLISFGVAAISFVIGILAKALFGISV